MPGAAIRLKLRSGQAHIMDSVGAVADIPADKRFCRICKQDQIEDAEHFVSRCTFYEDLRSTCRQKLHEIVGSESQPDLVRAIEGSPVDIFLGDNLVEQLPDDKRQSWDSVICNFLRVAWRRRDKIWRTLTVADDAWKLL